MQPWKALVLMPMSLAFFLPPALGSHADGFYDMPVILEWEDGQFTAVIIPPEHGQVINNNGVLGGLDADELGACTTQYLAALLASIQGWRDAVAQFGSASLAADFSVDTWVAGCDPLSEKPDTVDIWIGTYEASGPILGFAMVDEPCVLMDSRFSTKWLASFNYEDMYNVMSHEFGHCLGLGHTGDLNGGAAGDPSHPTHDTMEGIYGRPVGAAGTPLHCASNLNVMGLEAALDGDDDGGAGRYAEFILTQAVALYETSDSTTCNLRVEAGDAPD